MPCIQMAGNSGARTVGGASTPRIGASDMFRFGRRKVKAK